MFFNVVFLLEGACLESVFCKIKTPKLTKLVNKMSF